MKSRYYMALSCTDSNQESPFDMNHFAKCAQVVFPLWTKWLVTNPMPTQHLGSNIALGALKCS